MLQFFLVNFEGGNNHHWFSWNALCFGKEDGRVSFRSIHYINKAFAVKAWWNLRTKDSLWIEFMEAKYCNKKHSVNGIWKSGHSQIWKRLMDIKAHEMEV